MEYTIHILGLNTREADDNEQRDDLKIYVNALIEDLRSIDDVSSVQIVGNNVKINTLKNAKYDSIHAKIKNTLKNYFEHLGPFSYNTTRRLKCQ